MAPVIIVEHKDEREILFSNCRHPAHHYQRWIHITILSPTISISKLNLSAMLIYIGGDDKLISTFKRGTVYDSINAHVVSYDFIYLSTLVSFWTNQVFSTLLA